MRPIFEAQDLPPIGTGESESLDFKVKYNPATRGYEIAKDIAAMANVFGGTILVGAQEDASKLKAFVALSGAESDELVREAEHAAKDRCSPNPTLIVRRIPHGSGFLVAINVSPIPGQPVGVRSVGEPHAWVFPHRVASQTDFYRPEELSMLMTAEYRRVAILIADIKKDCKVGVCWAGSGIHKLMFTFHSMAADKNVVLVKSEKGYLCNIPLDMVRSVQLDSGGGEGCTFHLHGYLAHFPNTVGYEFRPLA